MYYQLDSSLVFIYPREIKSHLSIEVSPPEVPVGKVAKWSTKLCPIKNTKTFGTEGTGIWKLEVDNRKTKLYTSDNQEYTIGKEYEGKTYDGIGKIPKWLTDEEPPTPEPTPEELTEQARSQRDSLIQQSDWTQMLDNPLCGNQEWLDYRQALRDIPQQEGFPENIKWPTPPEEL